MPHHLVTAFVIALILAASAPAADNREGAFFTGEYRNLCRELGKSDAEIAAKVDAAWQQLFYGDDETQRVYYPVGDDMAYIFDLANDDVRSEGMSYGMMIAVQLDKQAEFDRLWKWAKTYMQHADGPRKGYFAWQCRTNGEKLDRNPASDGEVYFVTALIFADTRWGSTPGTINDYRAEANAILHAMIHKDAENSEGIDGVVSMFRPENKLIVFTPIGGAAKFTDPSYHLPAFLDLWSRWAEEDRDFWRAAAEASRAYLRTACHPETGLAPDYSKFDGTPHAPDWNQNARHHRHDAWRVAQNIAMDWAWFRADPWQVEQSNRLLRFFAKQPKPYAQMYQLDGTPLPPIYGAAGGQIAMNAAAALAATDPTAREFVQELWDTPIPTGQYRYYSGMLYMFGLLHASGNYRAYMP